MGATHSNIHKKRPGRKVVSANILRYECAKTFEQDSKTALCLEPSEEKAG